MFGLHWLNIFIPNISCFEFEYLKGVPCKRILKNWATVDI